MEIDKLFLVWGIKKSSISAKSLAKLLLIVIITCDYDYFYLF